MTYLSDNGHGLVDCFWISSCFSDFVGGLTVPDKIESDHMPVEMFCKLKMEIKKYENVSNLVRTEKFVWCTEKVEMSVNSICSKEFRNNITEAPGLIDRPDESL